MSVAALPTERSNRIVPVLATLSLVLASTALVVSLADRATPTSSSGSVVLVRTDLGGGLDRASAVAKAQRIDAVSR